MNRDKDLEIILPRQYVRSLQRKVKTPLWITNPKKMILVILTNSYKQSMDDICQRFHQPILIYKSDMVLRWHRELVRRKWTFKRKGKPGSLTISRANPWTSQGSFRSVLYMIAL